jgi:hypothetical protein
MKTAATTATNPAHAAPRRQGFFKRILYWILDIDDITPEEARERMRNSPGFFGSLTPQQLEMLRNYDGPENFGPPLTKREGRDLERRLFSQN